MNNFMGLLSRPNSFSAAGLLVLTAFCVWGSPLRAQIASQPVPVPVQPVPLKLNPAELSQLLGPVALYPDALIALILPASTVPSDVTLGARYLQGKGNPDLVGNQPWDESVKSLVRYPEVLAWMDQNLDWTASVGEAFVEQPADVMNAIQALREQARAAGNLQDTPQQKVVMQDQIIRIVPADPQVIYVPQYDPEIVYVQSQSYYPEPLLTFGLGFAVGSWLNYDFDWNRQRIYRGNWRGWDYDYNNNWDQGYNGNQGGNQVNVVNIDINNANQWQPSESGQRQISRRQLNNNGNARYVGARSRAAGQQATGLNAVSRTAQPELALPRPSRLQGTAGGNGRNRGQDNRSGKPETALPSNPAVINPLPGATEAGKNRSVRSRTQTPENSPMPTVSPGLPGTGSPDVSSGQQKRIRTAPSAPPKVTGQMNNPDRNQNKASRRSDQPNQSPSLTPTGTPQSGNVRQPGSPAPQVGPAGERTKKQSQPTADPSQGSRNKAPSTRQVSQPTQPAPVIQQPQERPQAQPQRQQPQERPQVQPQRQQPQERPQVQPQRQQPQERKQAQPQRQQQPQERKQVQPQRQQPQEHQQAQPQRQQAPSSPPSAKPEAKAQPSSGEKPHSDKSKKGDEKKAE